MMDITKIRSETPGLEYVNHLQASGSGLMLQPVLDAITGHLTLESKIGGYEAAAQEAEYLDGVYDSIATLLNAHRDEIAVHENASASWCQAFYSLPLYSGDRILTCEAEYGANYVAYLQRAKRDGIIIDVIPSGTDGAIDLDALRQMIDEHVKLIAITWIPTNGGLVNPAAGVGAIAHEHNITYLLDGCQAVGQMPVDVQELQCDFFSATGRKFLRGPRGTGFLYARRSTFETLEPVMLDHFGADWTQIDAYELRTDARRFENWENSYALRAGLRVAIDYALALGLDNIQTRSWQLAQYLRNALLAIDGCQLRDIGTDQCAIVSFTIEGLNPQATVLQLRADGICIGSSTPAGTRLDAEARNLPVVFRAAPHYYNTEAEIDDLIAALQTPAIG